MPDPEATFIPELLDFATRPEHAAADTLAPTGWSFAYRPGVRGTLYRCAGAVTAEQIDLTDEESARLRQLLVTVAKRLEAQG
jgi:hypothetical protein